MLTSPTPTATAEQPQLEVAPFFDEIAEGPEGARAWWVRASDGTRLRMGHWPSDGGKGTIIMVPGRTEYIEKYGRLAKDMVAEGYGMLAFDYRGQGLADRPAHRRDMGHVESFAEYRLDMNAYRAAIDELDIPGPFYLIGHSLGGSIGLRALYDGLEVRAAAFTGPMWGLQLTPFLRKARPAIIWLSDVLGQRKSFAITTGPWKPMPFEDNPLTSDPDQFAYMAGQTKAHPELTLGGPSYTWVKKGLEECEALMALDPLDVPVIGIVGEFESITEPKEVHKRMASWPGGEALVIKGAQHEVLMEAPDKRGQTVGAILSHFAAAAP